MKTDGAPIFRNMTRLRAHVASMRPQNTVLANGCFDPLHVGHVRYLDGAKSYGDYLVVAINDDRSTRTLKGNGRPIMSVGDRARLIASLDMVDAVLIFSARNVSRILKTLRPQFHAKGTDYTKETVPELATSRALGVETIIVGDAKSHASSDIV
ncbi:MAG: adenylyltransferase/cytidyltransferase family protein, partial [Candidatus Krumholzibacteria bacterium]|nr:adenylyltransferase/cytidyltransferase family protein [Candidatus Krumholzibacteria bacterium]